jgi:hypothetical protein
MGTKQKKSEINKFQNGRLKKTEFFKIANSQHFCVKTLWIGPWVSGIFFSKQKYASSS